MQKLFAYIAFFLMVLPMTHGWHGALHSHSDEETHGHSCSAEDQLNACHLSIYHGVPDSCAHDAHWTAEDEECSICANYVASGDDFLFVIKESLHYQDDAILQVPGLRLGFSALVKYEPPFRGPPRT